MAQMATSPAKARWGHLSPAGFLIIDSGSPGSRVPSGRIDRVFITNMSRFMQQRPHLEQITIWPSLSEPIFRHLPPSQEEMRAPETSYRGGDPARRHLQSRDSPLGCALERSGELALDLLVEPPLPSLDEPGGRLGPADGDVVLFGDGGDVVAVDDD